jgi:hypothetical protein
MGFLVKHFEGPNYIIHVNMYVSILTFRLFREKDAWMCQYFLQAFQSIQEKNILDRTIFLPYNNETNTIPYDVSQNIFTQIYANAMGLFGPDNCIPIDDDSIDPFVTQTAEEEQKLIDAYGGENLNG